MYIGHYFIFRLKHVDGLFGQRWVCDPTITGSSHLKKRGASPKGTLGYKGLATSFS